jgi:hypothetical protein
MKKFFFVLAIGAFAACNNSSSTEAKVDSTKVDSTTTVKPVDSTKKDSTVTTVKVDSTKKDSTTKK